MNETITVNGVEYIRADQAQIPISGTRAALVACWNACDGMSTESMVELSTIGGVTALIVYGNELQRERNHAIAQRDELLKTLRHIELAAMDISCERAAIRDAARAAIAKAKEQI